MGMLAHSNQLFPLSVGVDGGQLGKKQVVVSVALTLMLKGRPEYDSRLHDSLAANQR